MLGGKIGYEHHMNLRKYFRYLYNSIGRLYLAPVLNYESRIPLFAHRNERVFEYGFALKSLADDYPVDILDVGSGKSSWPHLLANCGFHVTAIDKIDGYWRSGFFNRHFKIISDDITAPKLINQFDAITCISVLEHIPDHSAAIKGISKLLKPGGLLILSFPYDEYDSIENVYEHPDAGYGQDAPYICRVYSRKELNLWLERLGGQIQAQEYYRFFSGDYWTMGDRLDPPERVSVEERHQISAIAIRKAK